MAEAASSSVGNARAASERGAVWLPPALAAIAGLVMFAAFPPLDIGSLAWVALPLLFFAFAKCSTGRWGMLTGAVFGVLFYGPLLFYLSAFGLTPWLLVVLLETAFITALGYLAVQLNAVERPLARSAGLAALWVLFEYLRAHRGAVSFTLGDVYLSQWSQPALLQLAGVGGSHLITFVMVLLSAALATVAGAWLPVAPVREVELETLFRRKAARNLLGCYVIFFACFFWGNWIYRTGSKLVASLPEHTGFSVAYVQAAVPLGHTASQEETRAAAEAYLRLSETIPTGNDLVVWPETAIPAFLELNEEYRTRVAEVARKKTSYLLAGGTEPAPGGKIYNTQFLFDPHGRIVDRYRKVHLVLFGEYVPWRKQLRFLERFPIRPFDYAPGEGYKVMQAGGMKFGPLICFESFFPQYTRKLCKLGAEFLVITTSDHWARGTYEVAQHSRVEIFRAVEARRFVVRVATEGESMVITPFGSPQGVLEIGEQGVQCELVYPLHFLSTYHRWGDAPLLVLCCILWLVAFAPSQAGRGRESA